MILKVFGNPRFIILEPVKCFCFERLFSCIWVHCSCLQTHQKMGLDPIIDGCEPSRGCWELNSGPLDEQSVLLTTELSLQPAFVPISNLSQFYAFISYMSLKFSPYYFSHIRGGFTISLSHWCFLFLVRLSSTSAGTISSLHYSCLVSYRPAPE